ncbi:MAG: hypothetical protein WC836_15935 [Desulfobacula sp.]
MKKITKKYILILIDLFSVFFLAVNSMAGIPVITDMMITDVSTRSFSVIWSASEGGKPAILVFNDAEGLFPVTGIQTTLQPLKNGNLSIQTLAEDIGVMKVEVTGLLPDTIYYFKTITTSKSSGNITAYPETGPLSFVTTQSFTTRTVFGSDEVPFSNDLIVMDCYLPDGVSPAQGTLLVAEVSKGSYPISEFVGDSLPSPGACLDLNNIFSATTHRNMQLLGGESLTLTQVMGVHGMKSKSYTIPFNNQLAQIKPPLPASCYGDLDIDTDVDSKDLILFISEFKVCHSNCMADVEPDSDVDIHDLAQFAAAFGKTCP